MSSEPIEAARDKPVNHQRANRRLDSSAKAARSSVAANRSVHGMALRAAPLWVAAMGVLHVQAAHAHASVGVQQGTTPTGTIGPNKNDVGSGALQCPAGQITPQSGGWDCEWSGGVYPAWASAVRLTCRPLTLNANSWIRMTTSVAQRGERRTGARLPDHRYRAVIRAKQRVLAPSLRKLGIGLRFMGIQEQWKTTSPNFHTGISCNFTDFSDDLPDSITTAMAGFSISSGLVEQIAALRLAGRMLSVISGRKGVGSMGENMISRTAISRPNRGLL